jgi:hypothetical protein
MYKAFDPVRGVQRIADFVTTFGQLADEIDVRAKGPTPGHARVAPP